MCAQRKTLSKTHCCRSNKTYHPHSTHCRRSVPLNVHHSTRSLSLGHHWNAYERMRSMSTQPVPKKFDPFVLDVSWGWSNKAVTRQSWVWNCLGLRRHSLTPNSVFRDLSFTQTVDHCRASVLSCTTVQIAPKRLNLFSSIVAKVKHICMYLAGHQVQSSKN